MSVEKKNKEIPDSLPGLNIKESLRRLGAPLYMYADLVKYFCNDKRDFSSKFRDNIRKKDFKTASVTAHSLKGSAATISAAELSDAAKELEIRCETADEEQIMTILQTVEDAFAKVIASSGELCVLAGADEKIQTHGKTEYDPSKIPELLQQLDKSLQEFDPLASERCITEITGCIDAGNFGAQAFDLVQELALQADNYEFDAARKILQKLRLSVFSV